MPTRIESLSPTVPPPPAGPTKLLEQLIQAIVGRIGEEHAAGVKPLLDKVGQALAVLFPPPGGSLPLPAVREKQREKLSGTFDELEDVLEALEIAANGPARPGNARRGS